MTHVQRVEFLLFALVMGACAAQPSSRKTSPPLASSAPAPKRVMNATCSDPRETESTEPRAGPEPPSRQADPLDPANLCETADSNLAKTMASILDPASSAPIVPQRAWDKRTPPQYFDRVNERLLLTQEERKLLAKNGVVVSSRWTFPEYASAYHEIYQSELPIYVTVDSILHAIYASNDRLIADIETGTLEPLLNATLSAMHCQLAAATYPSDISRDLDLYLTVGRSLLSGREVPSVFGIDVGTFVKGAHEAKGFGDVDMFGRARRVDWSQYLPRGHYTQPLDRYFRAAMWLSRMEFNLVSRSSRSSAPGLEPDPRETPR